MLNTYQPKPQTPSEAMQALAQMYPMLQRQPPAPDRPGSDLPVESATPAWATIGLNAVRRYFIEGPNSNN